MPSTAPLPGEQGGGGEAGAAGHLRCSGEETCKRTDDVSAGCRLDCADARSPRFSAAALRGLAVERYCVS